MFILAILFLNYMHFIPLCHCRVNSSAPDSSLINAFKINSISGELTVGNVTLNYEVTPHYTVWVETT